MRIDREEGPGEEHQRELDDARHAVRGVLGPGERGDHVAEGDERHRAEDHEGPDEQVVPGDLDMERQGPTETIMTVWTIAIRRRMRTLLPTSCQRRSGVALSA